MEMEDFLAIKTEKSDKGGFRKNPNALINQIYALMEPNTPVREADILGKLTMPETLTIKKIQVPATPAQFRAVVHHELYRLCYKRMYKDEIAPCLKRLVQGHFWYARNPEYISTEEIKGEAEPTVSKKGKKK